MKMPQYKFVTVGNGDGKTSKLTGSIRGHAIRVGLQKTTASNRSRRRAQGPRSTRTKEELMFRFGPYGEMKPSQERSACGVESLGASKVDPLDSLPIPMNTEVDCLIKYYFVKFGPYVSTADRNRSWFPYALQSAPMMYSTLAMTAAFWKSETPDLKHSIQLEGIRQKGEAMREISTRLATTDSDRFIEEICFIISTMSTLAIVEVHDGDFTAAELHLRGVYDLFRSQREHLLSRKDFILCKSINLADYQVAAALGHRPIFPFLNTDQAYYLPASILEHAQVPLLDVSSSKASLDELRNMMNIVDDSVLRYLHQKRNIRSTSNSRSLALVSAAHVFMYVVVRQVPSGCPLVRRMCSRIREIVDSAMSVTRADWTDNGAALLWISFVGLLGVGKGAATGLAGQWWFGLFQFTIRDNAQQFHPITVKNLSRILSSFIWDKDRCERLLFDLLESESR